METKFDIHDIGEMQAEGILHATQSHPPGGHLVSIDMTEKQARNIIADELDRTSRPGAAEECRSGHGFQESVRAVIRAYALGQDADSRNKPLGFNDSEFGMRK